MSQHNHPIGFEPSGNGPEHGRLLVVVLHGWRSGWRRGSPDQMKDVKQAVSEAYAQEPGLDFYIPPLPYSNPFSSKRAAAIVSDLLKEMDTICPDQDPERYSRIVLIGYSLGAIFTRRLFLAATGIAKTVSSESELANASRRPWVSKVERIVSLGGLNRGWLVSGRLGWAESFVFNLIGLLGHLWPGGAGKRKPTIFEARRGAPFIVQTRLQWLAWRRSEEREKPPLVIQLLGTQDNHVAPDDAVDFAVDRNRESPYFYLELPYTTHENAIVFSPSMFDRNGEFGAARKKRFIEALTWKPAELIEKQIPSDYLDDTLPSEPDESVEHVVFVIHGIRDDGYWTRKIAQRIREHAAKHFGEKEAKKKWRCVTSSYGYFAMLPFLLPWVRTQKVEWLMDLYVGERSRYPNAEFSYLGHSNGTYLVARALEDYPAACFRNVLFAGSVVRRGYDWRAFLSASPNRVHKVLNMVATRDWVVALFPQGLEPLQRFFDLGGAGFGGFKQAERGVPKVPNLDEVQYVKGSHSAGLVETQWSRIADFIVNDQVPAPSDKDYSKHQSLFWRGVSKVSTVLLGVLLVLAIAILVWLLYPVFTPGTTATKAAVHTLFALLYLMGLRFVVTRV